MKYYNQYCINIHRCRSPLRSVIIVLLCHSYCLILFSFRVFNYNIVGSWLFYTYNLKLECTRLEMLNSRVHRKRCIYREGIF
jgi:hypothetical protein